MSTLVCFRAATSELLSCYSRLSGEIQLQHNNRIPGRRQNGSGCSIVRAVQDGSYYEKQEAVWIREEQKWLREEERWMREDKRWMREEVRWTSANQALQDELKSLKKELEELRGQRASYKEGEITDISLRNLVAGMKTLLQALAVPGSEDLPFLDGPEKRKQISGPVSGETTTTYYVESTETIVPPVTYYASPDKNIIAIVENSEATFVSSPDKKVIAGVTPKASPTSSPPEVKSPTQSPPTQAPPSSGRMGNGATSRPQPTTSANKPPTPPASKMPTASAGRWTLPSTGSARTMKSGMDGDDVKRLQDALSELGFFSGDEDVEFSMFSGGTDSAVRTWQSARGVSEDGKVTKELMEALLAEVAAKLREEKVETKPTPKPTPKPAAKVETKQPEPEHVNWRDNHNPREIDKYERSDAQETGFGGHRRVYLLGENRWEEPGRVQKKQDEEKRIKTGSKNGSSIKPKITVGLCFQCRGVRTMLCTDCEGTGDLNVEEQFLEWVDDGEAKCPYCEGTGAVACDVCYGEAIAIST